MVISFSVKEARDQLMNEGVVYTYRWTPRKKVGKNWANAKRGTKKIADVHIEDYGERSCDAFSLGSFASQSGFKDVNAWIKKIMEMANPTGYLNGNLYKVTLVSQDHCCFWDSKCTYPDPQPECVPGKCRYYFGDNWDYGKPTVESQQLRTEKQ